MMIVEPTHDREDFGTELEIGWSNFLRRGGSSGSITTHRDFISHHVRHFSF